jgi:hypothetical protein
MTQPAPGWYPDPSGQGQRYFDGQQWTGHHAPQLVAPTTPTTVVVKGPNHALHAVLTFFTCGFWAPVWIIVTIAGSKVKVTR